MNREQIYDELDRVMNREVDQASSDAPDKRESHVIKTFMLEADLKESEPTQAAIQLAGQIFSTRTASIRATDADELLWLSINNKRRKGTSDLYLDCLNPRYWLMHCAGHGDSIEDFVKASFVHPALDHAWMPSQLLDLHTGAGQFRGFRLSYNRKIDKESSDTQETLRHLSMNFISTQAKATLKYVRDSPSLKHGTALAKIKLRLENNRLGSVNTELFYDGKATARGTSFRTHLDFVNAVYGGTYATSLRKVEEDYSLYLHADDKGYSRIKGEPIIFHFDEDIPDLAAFCDHLFSSTEPYRLWGMPIKKSDKYYRIQAVDLHVGSQLAFEIFPRMIRVFLPQRSCGNSILRFYTNLQHGYDALVRPTNSRGEPLFDF